MSLLFNQDEWDHTFCSIKSECYCPEVIPGQNIQYLSYKDEKCDRVKKIISNCMKVMCPTKAGRMLMKKVVQQGLSVFDVYCLQSESRRCVITDRRVNLVMFRMRTFKRRRSNGVIQLGETRFYSISREWLTCIQAMIVCCRLQKYLKHYALLDTQGQLPYKQQIGLLHKVNSLISYVITMIITICEDKKLTDCLLSFIRSD